MESHQNNIERRHNMSIKNLYINYMENPKGFDLRKSRIQWELDQEEKVLVQIQKDKVIYEKEIEHQNYVDIDLDLDELTTYTYSVTTASDSKSHTFITPKYSKWDAKFITPAQLDSAIVEKEFEVNKEVDSAYISIVGLGVYEAYVNNEFVNQEYLMPGYHCYNDYIQVQTYPLSVQKGKNTLSVLLGNGWYKGRLGFDGGFYKVYGDQLALIFEIKINYVDGSEEVILSDDSCTSRACPYVSNGIYDGEVFDATLKNDEQTNVSLLDLDVSLLEPRVSLPIAKRESFKPELIITPNHEKVLDFKQNIVGWVECNVKDSLHLRFGEILQDGCFYNENYRTASFGYQYKGDGKQRWVRPHFAFFGFRYVLVEGLEDVNVDDFIGYAIYSDLNEIGQIETGNTKVNQLISNAKWSQKDNFLDVPTDCPQRDERLGWTGDAQVFSGTALFNMNCIPFYSKYMKDMKCEQSHLNGGVPNVIPCLYPKEENYGGDASVPSDKIKGYMSFLSGHSFCPWADAATIIPWNTYKMSGNVEILKTMYPSMKAWADYQIEHEDQGDNHTPYLFDHGFHFADWLALDNPKPGPLGKTDTYYVASLYYYVSCLYTSKAAKVLGYEEADSYYEQAMKIKEAIRNKYMTDGMINVDTQTGFVLALCFDVLEENEIKQNADALAQMIKDNNGKLSTGFVGTPKLCFALSQNGYVDLAYNLLLNEEYPGWLYEINLGATTIWERWNSVLEDGHMNPEGMNSLNHYSYGSIVEWLYREAAGLNELTPGFTIVKIEPKVDKRLGQLKMSYQSVSGTYKVEWKVEEKVTLIVDVPTGCETTIILPISKKEIQVRSGHFEFVD